MNFPRLLVFSAATLLAGGAAQAPWNGYAGDPQHTALSSVSSLPLKWRALVHASG